MKPLLRSLLSPILLLSVGCSPDAGGDTARIPDGPAPEVQAHDGLPIEIQDASGRTLFLASHPRRILSLVPSGSETLLSIGAGGLLVGRTDFDSEATLGHLPSVGGGLHPNIEAILALSPDLVIRFAGDSDTRTPERLDQMGIPHLAIDPQGIQDIREIIRLLGVISGYRAQADSVLSHMDAILAEIRDRVRDRPRLRVGYVLGGNPPWVAGPGSFIDDLMDVAGGRNVFSDLGRLYGPVNAEVFLDREIDLLVAAEGASISIPRTDTPLRFVPPSVEIPGPLLAEAALEMARALHPGVFR